MATTRGPRASIVWSSWSTCCHFVDFWQAETTRESVSLTGVHCSEGSEPFRSLRRKLTQWCSCHGTVGNDLDQSLY